MAESRSYMQIAAINSVQIYMYGKMHLPDITADIDNRVLSITPGMLSACANSRYQALFPIFQTGMGMRL